MKPKCVLLDANIVIEAYVLGVWEILVQQIQIVVPSIVANDEALFYKKEIGGIPEEINLRKLIETGKITEFFADSSDLASLNEIFDRVFLENIHAGEREALALVYNGKAEDAFFCTSDSIPIQAMAILRLPERAISFERLLTQMGVTKKLSKQFTEKWFQTQLVIGHQDLITGEGVQKEYLKKIIY